MAGAFTEMSSDVSAIIDLMASILTLELELELLLSQMAQKPMLRG